MTAPIRSGKILRHARNQPCTLRFHVCNNDPTTTVACHIRDQHKGMGIKASDHSVVFGCSACHSYLDEGEGGKDWFTIARALIETWAILIRDLIIIVPQDKPKKARKSKPKAAGRSNWPPKGSRKIPTRSKP